MTFERVKMYASFAASVLYGGGFWSSRQTDGGKKAITSGMLYTYTFLELRNRLTFGRILLLHASCAVRMSHFHAAARSAVVSKCVAPFGCQSAIEKGSAEKLIVEVVAALD